MDPSQEAARAEEHFEHLVGYGLVKCKECPYAVWPDQIAGHLCGKHHKMKRSTADAIAETVQSWPGLMQYPGEFEVPTSVEQPIPQLPLYDDGLLCQLDPERCKWIFRKMTSMKKHWRKQHQWSARNGRRGGSGSAKKQRMEAQLESAYRTVHSQRFFQGYHGSQYFEVRRPNDAQEDQARHVPEGLWDRIQRDAQHSWDEAVKKDQERIKEGEASDGNPWLTRTGWAKYLKQFSREDLLAAIQEPDVEAGMDGDERGWRDRNKRERWDDNIVQRREGIAAVVWKAMREVARTSQLSVIHSVGVFIRMEAIRTEKHQTRFQPLQSYMDEDSVDDRVRSWQQILMFFVRTQAEHDWGSPEYQFTRRQFQAFQQLIEEAEREVNDEQEEGDEDDEDDDGQEEEEDDKKPQRLTGLQKACLDFCIELLNQTVTRREYDSALVCALAVLGVTEKGWKGPDQYPQVLSAVIKIARFMVVQKALEMRGTADGDNFNHNSAYDFNDSGYESDGSNSTGPLRQQSKGCLQFVAEMMDSFMIRGSHSPMQWMLDLRTYGLKIHYNTTAPGLVGCNGPDEILYKHVQFTMPQFRAMVHGLVTKARGLMEGLLFCGEQFGGEEMPRVPWQNIRDDPSNEEPGFNYLHDQRTRMPVDGKVWLFDRINRDSNIKNKFIRQGSQTGVNRKGVEEWIDKVVEFQKVLLILKHITGESRKTFHGQDRPSKC